MGKDIRFQLVLRRRRSSLACPDVQAIFDKHVSGATRRLLKEGAIDMLMTEFGIEKPWAEQFFTHFDADSNDVFSLWEFQHFFTVVGKRAPSIVARFCELDTNNDRMLEVDDLKAEISQMKAPDGGEYSEKEIAFFMKTAAGEKDTKIDIGHYSDLLYRIQMFKRPPKRN